MASSINADNGAVSGSAGLKSSADSSGVLALQTNGTTAVSISAAQVVSFANPITGALNGTVGATTPSTGAFTTLSASTSITSVGSVGNVSTDSTGARLNFSRGADNYFQASTAGGYFAWVVNGSGSNAMTLDSSGNLGLGVTPSAWVNTTKAIQLSDRTAIYQDSAFNSVYSHNQYQSATGNRYLVSGSSASLFAQFTNGSFGWLTAPSGTAGAIATFTQPMTLDGAGNLFVGTTSQILPNTKFNFSSSQATALGGMGFVNTVAPTAKWQIGPDAAGNFVVFNGSAVGVYVSNGGTSWTAYSDERLKTTLVPFENASAKVATLRAGTGRYLKDEEGTSRSFLIAQDVQKVLPEAVDANNPDALGLSYTDVIPLLVAAIKEQQALITTLTDRITALENK